MTEALGLVTASLGTPVVLSFALGVIAVALRSDLKIPEEIYAALSIHLLLAIGLKGGSPGRFSVDYAAAIASHYGAVSVVTFIAGASFVEKAGARDEGAGERAQRRKVAAPVPVHHQNPQRS